MNAPATQFPMVAEHPLVSSLRLRAMRRVLWMRRLWAAEPPDAHPAAIQHEEVDRILTDPAALAAAEAAFYEDDPQACRLGEALATAARALAAAGDWQRLGQRLELSEAERQLLATALALALEPQLGRVYAYLHDQPEMDYATPWLAAALHGPGAAPASLGWGNRLARWGLLVALPSAHAGSELLNGWGADPGIANWLAHGGTADLPPGAELIEPDGPQWPVLYPQTLQSMREFATTLQAAGAATIEIELAAPPGSGRRTLAAQFAAARRQPLLIVGAAELLAEVPEAAVAARVLAAARAARLRDAAIYWHDEGDTHPGALDRLRPLNQHLVVGRSGPSQEAVRDQVAWRSYELPSLDLAARLALWEALGAGAPPPQVREWLLTPAELVAIRRVAGAGATAIAQACRRPTQSAGLLARLPLPFSKADLILPEGVQRQLEDLEQQIRHRWEVYEEWGFDRLCPNGRGIVALFAGPSGTGKTMAAQVLARALGLELYRLDPANVVNKYIGETEKRLKLIFDECDRANFLLLIDECEGLFGQRFSSKDAHDRYANLEIDYLLQRLERFQGVAILASNRKNDLDPAFLRRIRAIVDFLPPGPPERATLWRAAFDADRASGQRWLDGIEWEALTERLNLTGAEINLAALNAAFLARAQGEKIGMKQILTAVRRELAKKGQTLRGFE
ncbi:AAA family ATPase [uncultured Thiodictyon sp.]|uniref:ATP-binding protein n=1 Tax=uncultured Thiodictyon sp. TaxID=1846217 RepID=UPI0025CB804F|nr:AAA family ATPase [uncultured Thiodictyon sp.]